MKPLKEASKSLLNSTNVAVCGVSSKGDVAANTIYKKFREKNYNVYPVNPNAKIVEGDTSYPTLSSIPENLELVVIATHPDVTPSVMDECIELNIKKVWIHKSIGGGSYHQEAVEKAKAAGIMLIPGGCPMMFLEPVDPAHKCMKWFFRISGKEAKPIGFID
jgi:predicted CoA-binding protein